MKVLKRWALGHLCVKFSIAVCTGTKNPTREKGAARGKEPGAKTSHGMFCWSGAGGKKGGDQELGMQQRENVNSINERQEIPEDVL